MTKLNLTIPVARAPISVFLLGDNAVIREGLRALLKNEADIAVIGDAAVEVDASHKIIETGAEIVILETARSAGVQTEMIREIRRDCPGVKVVVVSMRMTLDDIFRVLQAGVNGYVPAEFMDTEITEAIRVVREGRRYLNQIISSALVDEYMKKTAAMLRTADPLFSLNMREREILQLVVEGRTSGDIADTLNLSLNTINTYRCRIMKKLGLKDLTELVRFAIRNGLTPLSSVGVMGEQQPR